MVSAMYVLLRSTRTLLGEGSSLWGPLATRVRARAMRLVVWGGLAGGLGSGVRGRWGEGAWGGWGYSFPVASLSILVVECGMARGET